MTTSDKILCAIVDDEHLARELLADYVSKIPNLELIGTYSSPLELMNSEYYSKIEILFLDIQMPDITGIDFLKTLRENPTVIFTTAYSEYALEGYELNVVEYLLKPIAFPRFVKATQKAIHIANIKRKLKTDDFKQNPKENTSINSDITTKDYIIIKADRKKYKVNFNEILYIEGALEYVTFVLNDKKITAFYSLKELENLLPSNNFMRVHRSYIVNYKKASALDGNMLIINDYKIPIGSSHRKSVNDIFED